MAIGERLQCATHCSLYAWKKQKESFVFFPGYRLVCQTRIEESDKNAYEGDDNEKQHDLQR